MKNAPLVEAFLFFNFVGILLVGGLWILFYKLMSRRLAAREAAKGQAVRRNSMDHFFGKLRFLVASEDRALGDRGITVYCLLVKLCTFVLFLLFAGMVFGPFLLGG